MADYKTSPISARSGLVTADQVDNKLLKRMFSAWGEVSDQEAVSVGLPSSGSSYFVGGGVARGDAEDGQWSVYGTTAAGEDVPMKRHLPEERGARYAVLRLMARDPTIDSALKMHIASALAGTADTSESVFITEREPGKEDKIVADLRATLMPIIRKNLNEWARKAAVYGSCFARIYGRQGLGIYNVRCDYYTYPGRVKKYEKGGMLAGYTTTHQNTAAFSNQLRLLPPWTFAAFEIPEWWDYEYMEPINVAGRPVDLAIEDAMYEGLVESQEYGTSLIATAYGPWLDLLDAICALRMSRRNAARLERIIGVNTGRLEPERAAKFLDAIAERIIGASDEIQNQSFLSGKVRTVINHVIPNFAEHGGIQVDAVQGTPDINGLEDVLFHVKRLGSAIGVDPALLGFGDFLAGGLGDGGFFRVSVMAATKADLLRKAIKNGLEQLCDIHVALKYGKVFLEDDKPWRIGFNALSTAVEREERETMEARSSLVSGFVGILATLDQEFSIADKRELCRFAWKQIKFNDDDFELVFPEQKAAVAADEAGDKVDETDAVETEEA